MTPVFSAERRFSFWDPLLLVVAGFMLLQGFVAGNLIPIITALGVGAFLAFTKHSRYELYEDALVIRYWAPRRIIIPYSDVRDVRSVRLPFGGPSLLVDRQGGRLIAIMPKDPDGFRSQMQAAMAPKDEPPAPRERADRPKPTPRRRRPRRQNTT